MGALQACQCVLSNGSNFVPGPTFLSFSKRTTSSLPPPSSIRLASAATSGSSWNQQTTKQSQQSIHSSYIISNVLDIFGTYLIMHCITIRDVPRCSKVSHHQTPGNQLAKKTEWNELYKSTLRKDVSTKLGKTLRHWGWHWGYLGYLSLYSNY